MSEKQMSQVRRRVLRGIVITGAAAVAPVWVLSAPVPSPRASSVSWRVLWTLADELHAAGSIDSLAIAYINRHPEFMSVEFLTTTLLSRLQFVNPEVRLDSIHAIRESLAHSVRADFDRGRVENMDGWQLSSTELQLCALAHRSRYSGSTRS